MCHHGHRMGQFSCPGGTLFSSQHETCDWKGKVMTMVVVMVVMTMVIMVVMIAMTILQVEVQNFPKLFTHILLQVACNKP